ncbi:CRISPR-associated endoribonuclease Cas2 [Micromonospora sp. MW-13]|uniref:CRISPR-associated endonuclease Cas2 n=1 Tax=unclassified Micromonospora TaxID=2617518 RepID=UPI000E440BCD|nr:MULTISPECIES: CRISPR-associated endonuclease Cas2 [unclassified Micromonospora]MCX4471948.1 CRISPR-associated endonuclease Cas2 [Micromonospora sp. NBC_01655]RGC65847.1 CRISPR-associated endoribonuclease Cas2 [Micromonospora sp. MW-13]
MDLLVAYDVETVTPEGQRRLRRVARICEAYGHRVQESVFVVVCRETDKVRFVAALQEVIDPTQDSVRIYRLPAYALNDVEHLGKSRPVDPRGALVI